MPCFQSSMLSLRMRAIWAALVLVVVATDAGSTFRLSNTLGSNMVLQRDVQAPVWGFAGAGVAVKLTWGTTVLGPAVADATGLWRILLPSTPATTMPQTLVFSSRYLMLLFMITRRQKSSSLFLPSPVSPVMVVARPCPMFSLATSIYVRGSPIWCLPFIKVSMQPTKLQKRPNTR